MSKLPLRYSECRRAAMRQPTSLDGTRDRRLARLRPVESLVWWTILAVQYGLPVSHIS